MNTKITVVIPTYNKAAYISQTIESILRQTYQDFEIVIIDDCSKDDTELVVQKYLSEKFVILSILEIGDPEQLLMMELKSQIRNI